MRKSISLLICLLFSALVFSQNKFGKISDVIPDESQKPLQSVSVSLLRAKVSRPDTRPLTGTFTWRSGKTSQQNQPRRRNSRSQDEQNRVGQSQ